MSEQQPIDPRLLLAAASGLAAAADFQRQYDKVADALRPSVRLTEVEAMFLDLAVKTGTVHQMVERILSNRLSQ